MKEETIKKKLSNSDVKYYRISINSKYRDCFLGHQKVIIDSNEYNIFDSGSSIYITGLCMLHKQYNAQEGTQIELTPDGENRYKIKYLNGTDCSKKKSNCKGTSYAASNSKDIDKLRADVIGNVVEVLNKMQESYHGILVDQKYLPTRGKIGFTERNLTFYFCHHYLELRKDNLSNIIVWQEMPLESDENHDNHRQHIDSIIIDKHDNEIDLFYIEAKRIFNPSFVDNREKSSLQNDYDRIIENCKLLPGYSELGNGSEIHHHMVLLAGLEIFEEQKEKTVNAKKDKLVAFKKEYFRHQNHSRIIGGIKGSTKNNVVYEIYAFYREIK